MGCPHRFNKHIFTEGGESMRVKSTILMMVIGILFGYPLESKAEGQLIPYQNPLSIVSDAQTMLVVDEDGKLISTSSPPEGEPQQKSIVKIDLENEYPVAYDGKVYLYHKTEQRLECVWPTSEPENNGIFIDLPDALTRGSDDWNLQKLRMTDQTLFFVYYDINLEESYLCRYAFATDTIQWELYEDFVSYTVNREGETYAVTYRDECTFVYSVNWQKNTSQEFMRIKGKYIAVEYGGNVFYAIEANHSRFVQIQNGGVTKSIYSPYAASVTDSVMVSDTYWVLGSYGLYAPQFDSEAQQSSSILRVEGSGPNPIDQGFLLLHPDVQIEYITSDMYQSVGKYASIATELVQIDVCTIDNSSATESFRAKGYTFDLSAFPALLEMSQQMYAPIQEFITDDGQLQMLPFSIRIDNLWRYNKESLDMAGLTTEDIPQTAEELLDLMIGWETYCDDMETDNLIVPILFDESPHRELLYVIFDAYINSYKNSDRQIDFDTEQFRRLLQKTQLAAAVSSIQGRDYNPQRLFNMADLEIPPANSISFPLNADIITPNSATLSSWMIYADSPVPDIAAEYIEYRMRLLSETRHFLLYQGDYEPIERKTYIEDEAAWKESLKELTLTKQKMDDWQEQQNIQNQIECLEENISNTPDFLRYELTADEISFYQRVLMPNTAIDYSSQVVESSVEGAWAWTLINQYVDGIIPMDKFISELNNRVQMIQLENN